MPLNVLQMPIYALSDTTGLVEWIDYIPVQQETAGRAGSTDDDGYLQSVNVLSDNTGLVAWVDYIPVYEVTGRTKPWHTDSTGYIPYDEIGSVAAWTPAALFASGEVGAWYDPSDLSTMFEDSAGGPPASLESIVGLILDKSRTETLGPELFPANGLDSDTNWTFTPGASTGWTVSGGVAEKVVSVNSDAAAYPISFGGGKWYKVQITVVSTGANCSFGIAATIGAAANGINLAQGGINSVDAGPAPGTTFTIYFYATSAASYFFCRGNSTSACQFSNLSIKEVTSAPSHAYQNAEASKPILRARYNIFTYSEQFDSAAWDDRTGLLAFGSGSVVDATTAPDGTTTAEKIVESTANSTHRIGYANATSINGATYTLSVYAKAAGRTVIAVQSGNWTGDPYAYFDLSAGTVGTTSGSPSAAIESVGDGWYRCSITGTGDGSINRQYVYIAPSDGTSSYTGDGSSGVYVWGAQLNYGSTALPYQRIAAATDYVTSSTMEDYDFPYYLDFDGVDDLLVIPAIDFSSYVEMGYYVAAQSNNADGGTVTPIVMNGALGVDRGAFAIYVPHNNATRDAALSLDGATDQNFVSLSDANFPYYAPIVITAEAKIDAGTAAERFPTWRINGAVVTPTETVTGNADTGLRDDIIRFGAQINTGNYSNMRLFQAIIRSGLIGADLSDVETYLAGKSGVTLA